MPKNFLEAIDGEIDGIHVWTYVAVTVGWLDRTLVEGCMCAGYCVCILMSCFQIQIELIDVSLVVWIN